VDAIKEALATISESDIRAWFEFCGYLPQRHRDIEKSDRARTYEALVDAIKEALATISESDIRAWFEFCGYSIP
jgi:hypothetical protein